MTPAYENRICIQCGDPTPRQVIGQPRKYCSDRCRSARYKRSRQSTAIPRSPLDRLKSKLSETSGGCAEFTGYRNQHGYGVIRDRDGRTALAHRVAWTELRGPIPEGLSVCHHCDNPPCCNPDHLFLGTHQENMDDRDRKGRTLRGDALRKARWGR